MTNLLRLGSDCSLTGLHAWSMGISAAGNSPVVRPCCAFVSISVEAYFSNAFSCASGVATANTCGCTGSRSQLVCAGIALSPHREAKGRRVTLACISRCNRNARLISAHFREDGRASCYAPRPESTPCRQDSDEPKSAFNDVRGEFHSNRKSTQKLPLARELK
jgi:hypothetical protein